MAGTRNRARRAFSLIELVVVVVIIGIIAAIAIPKMSRGAAGAAESAVSGDLTLLRQAVDMYQTEHGGAYPSATNIVAQLTQFSTSDGLTTSSTKNTSTGVIYGPYLRAIPPLPVGPANWKGNAQIGSDATSCGWIYDSTSGSVTVNPAAGPDSNGTAFSSY